jgi:sarcosine oxidase
MPSHHSADVVIVGLGAMGSAALYQVARRGVRAIGVDQFEPPHDRGSSHGESRITRQAIGEGDAYVPFALRSHEIWRELEAETGRSLFEATGGLILGRASGAAIHGQTDFVGNTIGAAKRFGIAHEVLSPDEVGRRFPQFGLVGDETCYYEPGAGFLRPELCISTQLDQARLRGAIVHPGRTVRSITADDHGATVVTDSGTYSAGHVIVTAGAWTAQLLGDAYRKVLRVCQQTMYWFAPENGNDFAPGRFPIFIWRHGPEEDDHFYGFPVVGDGVKVATEQFAVTTMPDATRAASGPLSSETEAEARQMHQTHVRQRLAGVSDRCLRSVTCLYTVTPDFGFIIDRHPDWDRVLVASPCSGHGFKHSAAIGAALAERVIDGRSRIDLTPFSLGRFG